MRWPWQRKRGDRNPYAPNLWPKKVYFLNGLLKGQQINGMQPCREFINLDNGLHGREIYVWDTLYRSGNVAYMRLA